MTGGQWLVRASWIDSSDTFYGPFDDADAAEAWARGTFEGEDSCTRYDVERLFATVQAATR